MIILNTTTGKMRRTGAPASATAQVSGLSVAGRARGVTAAGSTSKQPSSHQGANGCVQSLTEDFYRPIEPHLGFAGILAHEPRRAR